MTLVPFEQYVLAAEKLIAENPLGLKVLTDALLIITKLLTFKENIKINLRQQLFLLLTCLLFLN